MALLSRPGLVGVNRAHPANRNLRFSFVAGGGIAASDLATGAQGTLATGTPTAGVTAWLGNTLNFAAAPQYTFGNRPTINDQLLTFAAILTFNSSFVNQAILGTSSATINGVELNVRSSGALVLFIASTQISSTITLTLGVPYLIVASLSGLAQSATFLALRLDTGSASYSTAAATTAISAPDGTYCLGKISTSAFQGSIASALISATYFPTTKALANAFLPDPWGPWRPQRPFPAALFAGGSPTNVAPGAGSLVLTGVVPTVAAGAEVDPSVGSVVLTGAAPTVATGTQVAPDVGSITFSGVAPAVTFGAEVDPGIGSIVFVGAVPTVVTGTEIDPGVGSIVLAGAISTVDAGYEIAPAVGTITLLGHAPTVTEAEIVTPDTGTISFNGAAPNVVYDLPLNPGPGILSFDGIVPEVSGEGGGNAPFFDADAWWTQIHTPQLVGSPASKVLYPTLTPSSWADEHTPQLVGSKASQPPDVPEDADWWARIHSPVR